jgi:hypothetical protein
MAISAIATNDAAQVYATQKTQTATDKQNSQATSQTAAPAKPKAADTVTISSQALALLANSKSYSPKEEAGEPGSEKTPEQRLGQR